LNDLPSFGTSVGGIDEELPSSGDFEREWAGDGFVVGNAVGEVFDGVLEIEFPDGFVVAFRVFTILDAKGLGVVGAGDGAVSAFDDEAASGLRLVDPRVGEGAPTGFKFGKSHVVTDHGDAVFVDFQTLWNVRHALDFERFVGAMIPSAEGGAVAEIIEEGASAAFFAVPPGGGFVFGGRIGFDFVGGVVKGASISAVVGDFCDFSDAAFFDQLVGRVVSGEPAEGPVDGELFAGLFHGGDHAVRIRKTGRKGFFHEDVDSVGCDFFSPVSMFCRGGAEDNDVGLRFFQALPVIGEYFIGR